MIGLSCLQFIVLIARTYNAEIMKTNTFKIRAVFDADDFNWVVVSLPFHSNNKLLLLLLLLLKLSFITCFLRRVLELMLYILSSTTCRFL